MIQGTIKKEAVYRQLDMDSSSSLKEFLLNRKKYYKKYYLGETVEEEDNKATMMGRIVETLLMEPEEFDKRFHLSTCPSPPTGLMLDFVEALYARTMEATNEDGIVTKEFDEIVREAYALSGFKIKLDAVLNKFIGSDAEIYYKEIREVRSKGLTVIGTSDLAMAEKIVEELKTNEFTGPIVNQVSDVRYTVYNQLQIEGYVVEGHKFKSMIDKVIVDHEKKTIQVYDLKCTWAVENFLEEYYLYRRAYIQAYLYYWAAHQLRAELGVIYDIQPPKFIVCDSTNYYSSLIYALDYGDLEEAFSGFEHKGRTYPGVKYIIKSLKWAIENNRWDVSMDNYLSNGIVKLRTQDGSQKDNY